MGKPALRKGLAVHRAGRFHAVRSSDRVARSLCGVRAYPQAERWTGEPDNACKVCLQKAPPPPSKEDKRKARVLKRIRRLERSLAAERARLDRVPDQ